MEATFAGADAIPSKATEDPGVGADRARIEANKATQVSAFLTSIFEVSNPDASTAEKVTARELLDRGAARSDKERSGHPEVQPISESAAVAPINPYGASKAMVERMLADVETAHGLRWTALRYFNACGADPGGGTSAHSRGSPLPGPLRLTRENPNAATASP